MANFDPPRHILAASALVQNPQGEILLVYHPWRGWEMPGGQVEVGEDLLTGVKREVLEESGIETAVTHLLALYSNIAHDPIPKLMFTFAAVPVGGTLQLTAETTDVGWFSPEDALAKVTHPAQHLKLQDALTRQSVIYAVYRTSPFQLLEKTIFPPWQ